MQKLPLLFQFKQLVRGNGFTAGVQMHGRSILDESEGDVWITGVAPSSFAGGGVDRAAAFVEFRKAWVEILFDIAQEAASFDDFERECQSFLSESAEVVAEEWSTLLGELRSQKITDATLPSQKAEENPVRFDVSDLTNLQLADQNVSEAPLQQLAA